MLRYEKGESWGSETPDLSCGVRKGSPRGGQSSNLFHSFLDGYSISWKPAEGQHGGLPAAIRETNIQLGFASLLKNPPSWADSLTKLQTEDDPNPAKPDPRQASLERPS